MVKILGFDFSIYNEIWTDWISAGTEGNMLFNFCEMMKIVFSFVKITTRFLRSANKWVQDFWKAGVASALIKPIVESSTQNCMLFAPSFNRCSLPWTWTEVSPQEILSVLCKYFRFKYPPHMPQDLCTCWLIYLSSSSPGYLLALPWSPRGFDQTWLSQFTFLKTEPLPSLQNSPFPLLVYCFS